MITYNLAHYELVWNLIKNTRVFSNPKHRSQWDMQETSKISYGFED